MAKISMKQRELKRTKTVERFTAKRVALKIQAQKKYAQGDIPWTALEKIQALPRNASPSRQRSRCHFCGRAHGVYKKFGLCRIHLRNYAMAGFVPGLHKASW